MKIECKWIAILSLAVSMEAFAQEDERAEHLRRRLTEKLKQIELDDQLGRLAVELGHLDPRVAARSTILQIDTNSPSLQWFSTTKFVNKVEATHFSGTSRERITKLLKLDASTLSKLDDLCRTRIRQHNESLATFDSELSNELIDPEDAIARYQKVEFKAEKQLAEKFTDVLDPNEFQELVKIWGKSLDMPIAVLYLGLNDRQYVAVQADSAILERVKRDLLKRPDGGREDPRFVVQKLRSSRELFIAMYKPYSHLNPDQFLLAKIWLKEWQHCKTFNQRLEQLTLDENSLKEDERISKKAEIEILGELYKKGAEQEKP